MPFQNFGDGIDIMEMKKMALRIRSKVFMSFFIILVLVIAFSYFLEHVVLQLPILYTMIFIAFQIIVLIVGITIIIVAFKLKGKK